MFSYIPDFRFPSKPTLQLDLLWKPDLEPTFNNTEFIHRQMHHILNLTYVNNLFGWDTFDELSKACELFASFIATLVVRATATASGHRLSVFVHFHFAHVYRLAKLATQRHHVVDHTGGSSEEQPL